ncbi:MAG: translation initiation factor IF-3 [Gammaproteobacteria bacterium RIFCSPHIGHO2_12_FULL_40_19]|nr:MAG: translation initiation factor IF-3 [Gammaproteobacteria bacterium RIFCSPHIGHO2_12_FULL_40_19]
MRASKNTRVNDHIRVPRVRLIDKDGEQVGIVSIEEALTQARLVLLDLVEISPNVDPPVCRIMDYGKYVFDQSKRRTSQKKNQKQVQVKEVKFRPVTDIGDFRIKMRKIAEFLERGDRVKISLRFRGREVQHQQLGVEFLDRVKAALPEGSVIEQEAKMEGRQITMLVAAGKK